MKLTLKLIAISAALGLFTPIAFAQLGNLEGIEGAGYNSHNTKEDLANSLIPAKPRRGREKLEEVDPSKLQSHRVKNKTFEGSLLDADTVKLDRSNAGTTDKSAKSSSANEASAASSSKSATSSTANETSATKAAPTTDKGTPSKSSDAAEDRHEEKKEKQSSTATGQSEDKTAAVKSAGGDH